MGPSNQLTTGLISLLRSGLTDIRPVRETISRLISPVISSC